MGVVMYDRDLGVYFSRSATAQQPQVMDKKKTKKWKKKKRVEVDGGPDLRLHRAETAHVSRTISTVSHGYSPYRACTKRLSMPFNILHPTLDLVEY